MNAPARITIARFSPAVTADACARVWAALLWHFDNFGRLPSKTAVSTMACVHKGRIARYAGQLHRDGLIMWDGVDWNTVRLADRTAGLTKREVIAAAIRLNISGEDLAAIAHVLHISFPVPSPNCPLPSLIERLDKAGVTGDQYGSQQQFTENSGSGASEGGRTRRGA